jgi:hypothetical protein
MPAASFAAGGELRICQAIPMQCVTGEYSYDPIFPDSDPDVRLVPDLITLKRSPWASTPRYLAVHDAYEMDGTLCEFAPRSVLKNVVARYAAAGLTPVVAPEIEFYLTAAMSDPALPLVSPLGKGGRPEVGQSAFSLNALNSWRRSGTRSTPPSTAWASAPTPGCTRWARTRSRSTCCTATRSRWRTRPFCSRPRRAKSRCSTG